MPEPGPARRRRCGRRMAGLAWKWPRTRLPVGASALGVFVLCWLYVFPVYRLPDEKEIVQGVLLQQGKAWRRNQTAGALFRKLLEECCDPGQLFAMTKLNSPMGKNLWFDGEFLYSFTIDNATYSLFPQKLNTTQTAPTFPSWRKTSSGSESIPKGQEKTWGRMWLITEDSLSMQ